MLENWNFLFPSLTYIARVYIYIYIYIYIVYCLSYTFRENGEVDDVRSNNIVHIPGDTRLVTLYTMPHDEQVA